MVLPYSYPISILKLAFTDAGSIDPGSISAPIPQEVDPPDPFNLAMKPRDCLSQDAHIAVLAPPDRDACFGPYPVQHSRRGRLQALISPVFICAELRVGCAIVVQAKRLISLP